VNLRRRAHRSSPSSLLARRRVRLVVFGGFLAVSGVAAACGVSPDSSASRIEPTDVPFGLLDDEPTTTSVGSGRVTNVYLLTEDRLVAVERTVPKENDLADLLEVVVSGPSEVEQSLGITSAIPAGTVASVTSSRGIAEVDLTAAFGDVRSREQLLALGQIVYTLTGQPGIGGVRFTLEGEEITVPLADGTLSDDPLARDDFEALQPA
jgi:Sporulation and spore germination